MAKTGLASLGVLLGLVLASCSSTSAEPGGAVLELTGRTFVGDAVTVGGTPDHLVPGSTLRLTFQQDGVGASAGCNSLSGPASWDHGTLVVDGALASTEMGCDPDLMDQDIWLADLLTSRPTLTLSADSLAITDGDTVVTLVDEQVAVPDLPLTGTTWHLDSITRGDTVSSVPQGAHATLRFTPDGTLHADVGCNTGTASYTVSGNDLLLGPMGVTQRACAPPASAVETAILATLGDDVTLLIDGDRLTLTPSAPNAGAPTALSFRARA